MVFLRNHSKSLGLLGLPLFLPILLLGAGGGGSCTYSTSYGSATSISLCTVTAGGNGACGAPPCNCTQGCGVAFDCYKPAVNFTFDVCDRSWTDKGGASFADASGLCEATTSLMGALVSCTPQTALNCGSMENISFAQYCIPAALKNGPCGFTVTVSSISCAGGGGDLQWGVYTTSPATAYAAATAGMFNCTNGTGMSTTDILNGSFNSGQCYKMIFDGNCLAACTWNLAITPNFTPTVTASNTTVCANACASIAYTGTCWTQVSWTSSDGQSGTSTTSPLTFCPCATGAITLTLTPQAVLGGSCATVNGTPLALTITSNAPTLTLTPPSPNGGCNATIGAAVTCGTISSYLWSGGSTTATACGGVSTTQTVTVTATATDASANCSKTYTTTASASVSWSSTCGCANCGCLLPIELLSFTGEPTSDKKIKLMWNTATETNNDFYSIEHSVDGNNFEVIGQIKGNGNSTIRRDYSFIDKNPSEGVNYYRLKQVDFNKKFTYTNIISVKLKGEGVFQFVGIRPIPATERVFISYFVDKEQMLSFEIYNVEGKKMKEETFLSKEGTHTQIVELNEFASGVYLVFLKKKDNTSQTIVSKFVKN